MSDEKQESLADIVAEMRQGMNPNGTAECQYLESDICTLADRIEAAWKREKAETEADALNVGAIVATTEKSSAVGNAAAMRDALLKLDKWIYIGSDGFVHGLHDKTGEIERTIKAALSEPLRNCDVGTEEEQANRFHNFCVSNSGSIDGMCDPKCPCIASIDKCHCLCKWEQMPYEEKGGK